MTLIEYFRLPLRQRLSRKEIAAELVNQGHEITAEAVGVWINKQSVPDRWCELLESVLNSAEKSAHLPPIKINGY